MAAKLARFLTAIERVVVQWERKQFMVTAVGGKKSIGTAQRSQASVALIRSKRKKDTLAKEKKEKVGNIKRTTKKKNQRRKPQITQNNTTERTNSATTGISFDCRSIQFGHAVLRSSTKRKLNLCNDTKDDILVLLSLKAGSGFSIYAKRTSSTRGIKFLIAGRSKLLVPLRFYPILLGSANDTIIATCTTNGKAVVRCAANLSGVGV